MAAGLGGLIILRRVLSPAPLVVVAQLAALTLMVWARRTFGRRSFHLAAHPTSGGLVTTGPYGFIRHPIYAAICLFVWAGVFGNWSLQSFLLAFVVTAGAIVRMLCEERLLVERYPEYEQYRQNTRRMIPYFF